MAEITVCESTTRVRVSARLWTRRENVYLHCAHWVTQHPHWPSVKSETKSVGDIGSTGSGKESHQSRRECCIYRVVSHGQWTQTVTATDLRGGVLVSSPSSRSYTYLFSTNRWKDVVKRGSDYLCADYVIEIKICYRHEFWLKCVEFSTQHTCIILNVCITISHRLMQVRARAHTQ